MTKIDYILDEAHAYFITKQYHRAIFLYSQACLMDPSNIEYRLYCIFCDIGYENDKKAQSLFDYFILSKDIDRDNAIKTVQEVIDAYDGDNDAMMKLLKDISSTSVETLNAIDYKDFIDLVKNRGSFKRAYEDIMFSTKVAITTKEELLDFINNLIENDFKTTAYQYLDGVNEFFTYDQDVSQLYEKLKEDTK